MTPSEMRCDVCGEGIYQRRTLPRKDVGDLIGLEGVTVVGASALVCDACGEVMLDVSDAA